MKAAAIAGSLAMAGFGPVAGVVVGALVLLLRGLDRPRPKPVPTRLVLILLLIEIRSGRSVLAALSAVSESLPDHADLRRVARVASVAGIAAALETAGPDLSPVLAQLARAQRSGASLGSALRRLLDEDLAEERAARLSRARSLPVRLMVPITLLMLPGLVLLLYAPSLLKIFDDVTGPMF